MRLKIIITTILTLLSLSLVAAPAMAVFNPFCTTDSTGACVSGPCKDVPNSPACQQNTKQNGKTTNPAVDTIRTASNILAIVGGIAGVVVIIISGFMFATAGGGLGGQRSSDPNRAKNARAALI